MASTNQPLFQPSGSSSGTDVKLTSLDSTKLYHCITPSLSVLLLKFGALQSTSFDKGIRFHHRHGFVDYEDFFQSLFKINGLRIGLMLVDDTDRKLTKISG